MKLAGDWLTHPETQELCAALTQAGFRALFVGGCVRNTILGEPVADVDLTTDATPETVTRLAEAAGFKVVPDATAAAGEIQRIASENGWKKLATHSSPLTDAACRGAGVDAGRRRPTSSTARP